MKRRLEQKSKAQDGTQVDRALNQGCQGGNAGRVELEKTQTDGQNRYYAGGPLNQISMAVGQGGDG